MNWNTKRNGNALQYLNIVVRVIVPDSSHTIGLLEKTAVRRVNI